jgi:exopolysaccharide biosynthesis polyprenyl glycosylphosphotransferase
MLRNSIVWPIARILIDISCLFAAFAFTVWVSMRPEQTWADRAASHALYFAAFTVIWCLTAFDQRLFVSRRGEPLTAVLFLVTKVYFITVLVSGFALALYLRAWYSRLFFAAFVLSALAMMLAAVLVSRPGVMVLRRRYNICRVLFVGADEGAARLARTFLADEHRGYHIEGFLDDDADRGAALEQQGLPYLGKLRKIERLLIDRMIDEVYISLPLGEFYETVQHITHLCETLGVPVRLVGDMFPMQLAECDVTQIGDVPLLSLMTRPRYLTSIQLKRALEAVTALLLLAALTPLFALISLLLKLESRGPVFVKKSQAHGNAGQVKLWAFRVQSRVLGQERSSSLPPLTRFNRFVRRSGLEDLPQLFNVLLGQISYMGVPVSAAKPEETVENGHEKQSARHKPRTVPIMLLAVLDAYCVTAAYVLAILVTVPTPAVVSLSLTNHLPFLVVLLLAWYAAAVDGRLWRWRTVEPLGPCAFGLLRAAGNAAVVCGFLLAVFVPGVPSTRRFLVAFFVLSFVALLLFRISARFLTRVLYLMGFGIRRVLVVGANERTEQIIRALGSEVRFGYRVAGIVEDEAARAEALRLEDAPYLGGLSALKGLLEEQRVDEVYVTLPIRSQFDAIKTVVGLCEQAGIAVHIVANLLPLGIARSQTILIQDTPLISLSPVPENYTWLALKRLTDFVASSILIAVFAPLFIVLAILIKRDSEGPVFFIQDRIGQNHRRFRMIKFRSMTSNAEELKKDLMHLNEADGPVFKIRNDPRVTRLGFFLRKYSLDELPQLFNVWLGQMSLVGPRPLMPHEVDKFEWFERRRLSVKPGMTGPWQVSGRSDIAFTEWVQMDLAYIDSWSYWQDFRILLKTFNAVLSGRGAA